MTIIDTNKLEALEKRPGWRGHIFHSQTMTFAHWDFAKGATIHRHDHEQEEVWHVVEGKLELTIGGETHIAGPGMVAIVPPHTAHEVKALTGGKAIVADYPLRKDFDSASMTEFRFQLHATDGAARHGAIHTPRGEIRTPAFMPLGTAATVKAMLPASVRETGADIILGNTYHLMLRPTAERIARLGGLHKFMAWERPILTDSGGFQVMSLSDLRKIAEEGVRFRSHIDGSEHFLSPERAMEIQRLLGSDIQMVLDECPRLPASEADIEKSLALSMRWAVRSKAAFGEQPGHACFGIVQGGTYAHLRRRSAQALVEIGFDGYAVGGLAVGETQSAMFDTLDATLPHLPADRPRYLMGVGKPDDIAGAVLRGIDMFDCVLPTRSGRTAQAFTREGTLNMRNARHAEDSAPLDAACRCPACAGFSRAYLHHVVKANEIIASMLLTWHNLTYYQDLMADLRDAIGSGTIAAAAAKVQAVYAREKSEEKPDGID